MGSLQLVCSVNAHTIVYIGLYMYVIDVDLIAHLQLTQVPLIIHQYACMYTSYICTSYVCKYTFA